MREWVERQGYPLEMRVAQEFRGAGTTHVEQSTYYTDMSSGIITVREIDVLPFWYGIPRGEEGSRALLFLFPTECKSIDTPWIVFTGSDEQLAPVDTYSLLKFTPHLGFDDELINLLTEHEKGLLTAADNWAYPGYQITEKRTLDKGGRDRAYDAVRQAACAALGALREVQARGSGTARLIAFPAVVTKSRLFDCFLDDDNGVRVQEVSSIAVDVRPDGHPHAVSVRVVNERYLPSLIDDCRAIVHSLTTRPC